MTGFNQVGDAPTALRVVNPGIEMMTNGPGWRPYILLDDGESETVDGQTYNGKIDEIEIPPASGGAGPLIGLHEAMINGDLDQDDALIPAGLLMGKFADAGKLLHVFSAGSTTTARRHWAGRTSTPATMSFPPVCARGLPPTRSLRRAKSGCMARRTPPPAVPRRTSQRLKSQVMRPDLKACAPLIVSSWASPTLPYYICAISEADIYDEAINDALRSLCRWNVASDGSVTDLGDGRDATSYFVDHGIDLGGSMHFDMAQMRTIGALVWTANQHLTGSPFGLTEDYPITAITPVHQTPPIATTISDTEIDVTSVMNEDGMVYGLIQPAGQAQPDAAAIISGAQESAPGPAHGRSATLSFSGRWTRKQTTTSGSLLKPHQATTPQSNLSAPKQMRRPPMHGCRPMQAY